MVILIKQVEPRGASPSYWGSQGGTLLCRQTSHTLEGKSGSGSKCRLSKYRLDLFPTCHFLLLWPDCCGQVLNLSEPASYLWISRALAELLKG